ncbi:MAG: hypothetical protein HC902_04875 [Calothrix sp. SM1_5_4]|nr:hypothetical protein [Calothrix sp. SM1_5_4]
MDRLARVSLIDHSATDLAVNAGLTGTLYQMAYDPLTQVYMAVEGNTIEGFNRAGTRLGNPFINTTVGACVLATTRGVAVTNDSRLLAVGTGNDRLLVYDVSNPNSPTCVSSSTALNAFDPIAVLPHSNGLIYVATQANDRIYSFPSDASGAGTVVWDTNLTYVNNPTALLEMPDGTILVASDGTNSIERITTDGTLVGSGSFIKDGFTGLVHQMLLVGGE